MKKIFGLQIHFFHIFKKLDLKKLQFMYKVAIWANIDSQVVKLKNKSISIRA